MSGKYKEVKGQHLQVDESGRVYDPLTDTWNFPKGPTPTPWRETLTPEDLDAVERAQTYAAFWTGVQVNDWRVLIDTLAKLLDERDKGNG